MITLKNKNAKIYIVSPYIQTGGPQSLHQLGYILNKMGYNVYMAYLKQNHIRDILYPQYNMPVLNSINNIQDMEDNLIILPETCCNIAYRLKKMKICIWWLSLDFYLEHYLGYRFHNVLYRHNLPKFIYKNFTFLNFLLDFFSGGFLKRKKENRIFQNAYHLYNCRYVEEYLKQLGINQKNMHYLCGPLEEYYLHHEEFVATKEDIIVYNPNKGRNYSKKIVKYLKAKNKNVKIIPLEHMSKEEIFRILSKAKVYFDFGWFPGPERMPREAVMCDCNIITSKKGSANNKFDVPISDEYKFDIYENDISIIGEKILELTEHYNEHYKDYGHYRNMVKEQILQFEHHIIDIFSENRN